MCDWFPGIISILGFRGGSDSKESVFSAGDLGSIPGSRICPGEGHGNLLQYSCLENPHGWRSLAGCRPWSCKESDMTEWQSRTQWFYSFLQNPAAPPSLQSTFSLPGMHFLQTLYDSLHHTFSWSCLHTVFSEKVSNYTFENCKPCLDQALFILSTCFIFLYRIFIIWHIGYILLFIVCVFFFHNFIPTTGPDKLGLQ